LFKFLVVLKYNTFLFITQESGRQSKGIAREFSKSCTLPHAAVFSSLKKNDFIRSWFSAESRDLATANRSARAKLSRYRAGFARAR